MAKNQTKAVLDNFTIRPYVDSLLESNAGINQRLTHFLSEYQKLLADDSVKEFMLYEEFGHGLSNFISGNKAIKKVINEMNTNLATYGKELNTYKLMECICDDAAKCACEDAYTHYLASNDAQSKAILTSAVDVLEQSGDPVAPQLTIVIANPNAQLEPQQISTFDNESKFTEIQRKIEEDKLRQKVEDAKAEIDAYAEKKYAEVKAAEEAERNANVYDNVVNANGICLGESIRNIMNSEAKSNKKLVETLEQYKGALNQGLYEERLYEGFIKNVSPFNYLKSVDKEIKRIEKVAEDHQVSINVTKILEEMYTTNSYYILPIIEEDVCRFIKNPTDVNCNQLKAALVSFAADPYCKAIMEELEYFNDKPAFLVNDKTMTIKDRAKLIKEHANVSSIYSPVQYIKENECVFNANGQFYVKKGNTLAKLSEEYIPQLSENFIALCRLVNDPHVIMNEDHITLVGNGKIANIFESYIDINGNKESIESVRNLGEMQFKYDFDNNFFIMTSCLAENFDNIANINFGKHIALNENEGLYVDLFNLNGNIFVNAIDESMLNATFYHNINPIQCRNLINNHMGINIASLFEELIPSQDKLYLKLNETKNEYEASIKKYEDTIEKLKKAKEAGVSEDSEKKLNAAIKAAEDKVEELKNEYADFQKDVDEVTKPDSKADKKEKDTDSEDIEEPNDGEEVERSNEPIDADDVEAAKAELSTPISGTSDLSVSDDEFDQYLEGDSEVPEDSDEMDPTEVNMVHHALDGDGKENEEPNPSELDNPMNNENPEALEEPTEEPTEDDEDSLTLVNTEDQEPDEFDKEINGEVEEPVEEPAGDESNSDEIIDFNDDEMKTPDDYAEEPTENPEDTASDEPLEIIGVNVPEGYKIANIKFDENLKTGELFRTGSITVMVDMVDGSGKVYTESNNYHFYIDEETHLPVIDAADVPVALYNALVSSVQADVQFAKADAEGKSNEESGEATKSEPATDEVYYNADDVNAASDEIEKNDDAYFDFTDDGNGDISFTAKEETPAEAPAEPEDSEDVIPAEETPAKPIKASDIFGGVEDEPDDEEIINIDDTVIDKPVENIDFEEPAEDEDSVNPKDSEEQFPDESANNEKSFDSDEKDFPDFDDVNIDEEPTNDKKLPKVDEPKNESVRVNDKKITLNEARAAFIKLKAEYKKIDEEQSFLNEGTSQPSKKEVNSVNEGSDWDEAAGKIAKEVEEKILKDVGPKIADIVAQKTSEIITQKANETINGKNNQQQQQPTQNNQQQQAQPVQPTQNNQQQAQHVQPTQNNQQQAQPAQPTQNNQQQAQPAQQQQAQQSNESVSYNTIDKLYEYAVSHADENTAITDIKSFNDIKFFGILNTLEINEPIAVYEMNDKIYYGDFNDLNEVIECADDDYKQQLELLESDQPQCVSAALIQDGYDLIDTLLLENCKIKKPGLTTNGDFKLSKKLADITNGTKDRREFERKVDRESRKAGVVNPLIPQPQQESVNIEDANELSESFVDKDNIEVIYEPMDWVIIKENGMKAQVQDVVNDGDGNLVMLTILASNGVVYDAEPDEIEPDPLYLANLPGNAVNSTLLEVPRLGTFDINPKTRLTDIVNNDDPALEQPYKDFNN